VDFEEEARRINDVTGVSALAPYNFERDGGIGLALTKPELRGLFQVNPWPKRYNPMAATVTNNPYENTNIDVLGRFGGTGIFASASNLTHAGAIKFLDGYKRNSVRANLDQAVGDKWTMQLQSFYSRGTQYRDGEWFRLTRVPAGVNLMRRDSEGRLFIRSNPLNQGQQNENPLYDNENRQGRNDQDRFLGSFNTRYTPLSWLDFDANASFDRRRTSGFNLTDRGFRVTAISQSNAYLGSLGQTNTGDQSQRNGSAAGRVRFERSRDALQRALRVRPAGRRVQRQRQQPDRREHAGCPGAQLARQRDGADQPDVEPPVDSWHGRRRRRGRRLQGPLHRRRDLPDGGQLAVRRG
jgi:hypothetical protein